MKFQGLKAYSKDREKLPSKYLQTLKIKYEILKNEKGHFEKD